MVKIVNGIELLGEREGTGVAARKGDRIVYNSRIFLKKGDEIRFNQEQAAQLAPERTRTVEGQQLIDHHTQLGKRRVIPGVERALEGMKPGGYRKVRISPHLAYRDKGIPGWIPPDAVLVIELWLQDVLERNA